MSGLEKQKPDWWCCDAEYGSHSDECVKRSISEAIAAERARCVAICDSEIEQAYRAGANAGAAESIKRRIREGK